MLNFISCLLLAITPSTYNLDTGWVASNVQNESAISHKFFVPIPAPGCTEVNSVLNYEYRQVGTITNYTDATLFMYLGGTMVYTLSHNANQLNTFDNVQAGSLIPLVVVPPHSTLDFVSMPSTYAPMLATYPIDPWYVPMGRRYLHKFHLTPHYYSQYYAQWIGTPHYSGHYPYSLTYQTEARIYGTLTFE